MADAIQATVDSTELTAALERMNPSRSSKIKTAFRAGTRKSLSIVRSAVRKGAAAVTSNREKRTKGVSVNMYKRMLGGSVGINKSFTLSTGKWFGLYLLELGTKEKIGRNGRRHGATPAKPFFDTAVSSSWGRAEDELGNNIIAAIDKAASRK